MGSPPRRDEPATREATIGFVTTGTPSAASVARITDMFLDHRYFDENASQSYLGRAVSCLSGRTAVYRRLLLLDVEQDFMNETFCGVTSLSGETSG